MILLGSVWRILRASIRPGNRSAANKNGQHVNRPFETHSDQLRHIIVRRPGNFRPTTYELDQPLGENNIMFAFRWRDGEVIPDAVFSADKMNLPVEPFMLSLAENLYKIPGVAKGHDAVAGGDIKMTPHQIIVTKTTVRTDEAVEADVLRVIAAAFGTNVSAIKTVVYRRPAPKHTSR